MMNPPWLYRQRRLRDESFGAIVRRAAGPLLDVWIYQPLPETSPKRRVVIVTYGCTVLTPETKPVVSHEHQQLGLFTAGQVHGLRIPDGYKRSIEAWFSRS